MGFVNSLKDETKFLFSGKGMPYEKVCLTVAAIISVCLSVLLAGNFAKDAPVIVIDLDNSRCSRELITQIDASEYMRVKAVINVATTPDELFFRDEADAVIYLPEGLEKNFYDGDAAPIGIFYDNSNTAQTADIKAAMNELVAINNAKISGGSSGGLTLNDRNLFNPAGSTDTALCVCYLYCAKALRVLRLNRQKQSLAWQSFLHWKLYTARAALSNERRSDYGIRSDLPHNKSYQPETLRRANETST